MGWRTRNLAPAKVGRVKSFLPLLLGAGACVQAGIAFAETPAPAPPPAAQAKPQAAPRPEPTFNIDAYDIEGNTVLGQTDIETAVYPYLGPNRRRDDVAAAMDALTKAYRDKGYSTVVVRVPQQDARTGIVRLQVQEMPVGRIRVVGAKYSLPSRIKEQMPALAEGQVPNMNDAQTQLTEVNRLPERQVSPIQKPGRKPGTVDIDLRVKDTLPLHASASVNNDHAQNTAQLRTVATVSYGNLWQLGHTISGTALLAPQSLKDTEVFSGAYTAPIWGTPWTILLSGYTSNSNVSALSGTSVLGRGYTISLAGSLQLPQWGDFIQSASLGVDYKHSLQSVIFAGQGQLIPIEYFPFDASYTLTRQSKSATLTASAQLTLGLRPLGSSAFDFHQNRLDARANFTKVDLDVFYQRSLPWDLALYSHLSAQWADVPLIANEQFSAGGLNTLRGYLQSEALGDEGIQASFTLDGPSLEPTVSDLIGKGILDDWRFYVFSDNAVAWVIDRLPEQRSVFPLASIGIGTKMDLLSHFSGNVLMGMPMRNGTATKAWHPIVQFSATTEF